MKLKYIIILAIMAIWGICNTSGGWYGGYDYGQDHYIRGHADSSVYDYSVRFSIWYNDFDSSVTAPLDSNTRRLIISNAAYGTWFSRPAVHYVGTHDRTYLAYYTEDWDVCIKYFDHNQNSFAQICTLATMFGGGDDHSCPSVHVIKYGAHKGKILVAYSVHNGYMVVKRSTNAEDLSNWEDVICPGCDCSEGNATYPVIWEFSDTTLILTYRTNAHGTPRSWDYRTSTDGGSTWSDRVILIRSHNIDADSYQPYTMVWGNDKNELHFAWNMVQAGYRFNVFYFRTTDQGDTWTRYDGTEITLPADSAQSDSVFITQGAMGDTQTYCWDIKLGNDSDPKIISIHDYYAETGIDKVSRVQWHYYVDGWQTEVVCSTAKFSPPGGGESKMLAAPSISNIMRMRRLLSLEHTDLLQIAQTQFDMIEYQRGPGDKNLNQMGTEELVNFIMFPQLYAGYPAGAALDCYDTEKLYVARFVANGADTVTEMQTMRRLGANNWSKWNDVTSGTCDTCRTGRPHVVKNYHSEIALTYHMVLRYEGYQAGQWDTDLYICGRDMAYGDDIRCDQLCETDFSDIVIANDDDEALWSWIQGKASSIVCTLWATTDSILAGDSIRIGIYYDSTINVPVTRDGDSVFLFFDDFMGGTLDTNKWDVYSGDSVTVTGGHAILYDNGTRCMLKSDTANGHAFMYPAALHVKTRWTGSEINSSNWAVFRVGLGNNYISAWPISTPWAYYLRTKNEASSENKTVSLDNPAPTEWHEETVFWHPDTVQWNHARNLDSEYPVKNTQYIMSDVSPLQVAEPTTGEVDSVFIGYIFVREHQRPEPQHGSWGPLETVIKKIWLGD